MKICKRIISCFICVLLLLQEISVNVNAMTIDRKTNGSYCIDLEEGDNGLYYPKYDNNKQYAKQLQQWIETLGYSEYFSDYTNKKDIEELLNETIEVPMVDDNNNMYLLESDIKVKELLAYIVFVEQAQNYAADMERDMLEEKSTSGSFSMDYEEFYNDLVSFYDTYITFEATVNGREELNRKLGLALCSRTAIEAVKNIKGVNTAYKYLGDYTRITYKADSDGDDAYYYIMSGGDASQYNSYIEKKLKNVDDFIAGLKGIKTTYEAFSGGKPIETIVAGINCFRDFSGHKYDNGFTNVVDGVVNAKSVLDGLNLLCENPWLFGMKEGVKFTTKYIEEVKKLIDSAEKKNAGWYAACIYNMYGSHDEALNSIINTNTLEVYNIFDSACNFPDDNTDGIYQKLITDYQNKFAPYGEGASFYMPEKSTRLQLIKAALLLKKMKEYDATELKESLIESLIAKLGLTAEYGLSADVNEISFGSFYKGDIIPSEDIVITNTSAYSVTLVEEATIYFDSTNVNGKILQPGETVVISVKPRTGSWIDGYYEEKLTLYCKEEPEAGLKVNLCMMLKDKQAENVQLAEKSPIEIGSNQILKIKNNQCILVEGDGKETVQEDIKELLYCGVILKGGKIQVYNDVYIRELEYIKGSVEGFNNATVTIDKLITQNGSGGLYFKGATYRVYSDATIKRNISTTSETAIIFEKNLETSTISIGNGDFEIYGKTTGRITMGSGSFVCRGDYEGGITMGTGKVRICGTFQQSQLLTMKQASAKLCIEKDWNAYGGMRTYVTGYISDNCVEAGTIEVRGNIYTSGDKLCITGDARLYLTGEDGQKIVSDAGISSMYIKSRHSDAGIYSYVRNIKMSSRVEIQNCWIGKLDNSIKLAKNTTGFVVENGNYNCVNIEDGCDGTFGLINCNVEYAGDAKGGFYFEDCNVMINGNCIANESMTSKYQNTRGFNIPSSNVIINKNFTTDSIVVNGRLDVGGDFEYKDMISMSGSEAYICINGNVYANGYTAREVSYIDSKPTCYLTGGSMEVKGNIIARNTSYDDSGWLRVSLYSFYSTGDFKLLLTGDGIQTIDTSTDNKIANLSQGEKSILQLKKGLTISQLKSDIKIKDIEKTLLVINGNENQVELLSGCTGNINVKKTIIKANTDIALGSLELSNSSAQIVGKINASRIEVNDASKIAISKDCETQNMFLRNGNIEIGGDCTYTGFISMKNSEDYLKIGGNLYANGYSYSSNSGYYLTNGTMELYGDIIARDNWSERRGSSTYYYCPFDTKDNFKLLMTGDGVQTISIPANNQVANLQQGEDSIIQGSNNLNITNLQSDCHMENVAKATIKNWNDYTLTNARCSGEIKFSYPNNYSYSVSQDEEQLYTSVYKPEQLSRPTSNISNGSTVELSTAVKLKQGNSRATIYYTLDGSDPTRESIRYTEPIVLTQDTRIRCMAVMDGVEDSDIAEYAYTIRRYQVTVASNVPDGLVTTDMDKCIEGTKVRIQIGEVRGRNYVADSLKVRKGSGTYCEVLEDENGYYFYMPKGNVTVQADYENLQYAITYHMDGGNIEVPVDNYTYSKGCELPLPIKEGYRFEGWYETKTYTGEAITSIGTDEIGEKEYWAKWQEKEVIAIDPAVQTTVYDEEGHAYTVHADRNLTGYQIIYYLNGDQIEEPIESGVYDVQITRPEDETYKRIDLKIFGGLIIEKAEVQIVTQPTVKDIKAGDTLQNAILDINSDAQVVSVENNKLPVYGTFEWEAPETIVDTSGDYYAVFHPVNENYNICRVLLPVTASGEPHKLLTSDIMEYGSLQFSADEAVPGEQIIVTVMPETGYHWTRELDRVTVTYNGKRLKKLEYIDDNRFRFEMPASDTSVAVELQLNTYTVTKEYDPEQGELEGPEQVRHGETAIYRAVPQEGYLVKDILVNGKSVYAGTDTVTVSEIQADMRISAVFEKKKVTFSYGTYEHGSITAYVDDREVSDGDILEYGTILTLEIQPEEGYEIKELTYEGKPVLNQQIRLKDTGEIKAVFGKTQETLDKEALAAEKEKLCTERFISYGTYPDLEEILYPEDVTANPEIQYRIQNMEEVQDYINDNGTIIYRNDDSNVKQVELNVQMSLGNVVDEIEITLQFLVDVNEYTVTAAELEHGRLVPAKDKVRYGEEIDYQVLPDEGYQMKAGSLCVNGMLTEKAIMSHGDVVLSAEFERIKYHIELDVSVGGKVTGDTEVLYGDEAKFFVKADPYYCLDSINVDDDVASSFTNDWLEIYNVHKDTKVQVVFKRKGASFYIEPLEHGTIIVQQENRDLENSTIVDQGRPISIIVKPNAGYREIPNSLTVNGKVIKDHSYFVTEDMFTIHGAVAPIKSERIQLSKTGVTLTKGENTTLKATVTPADALNKAVIWTSSNTEVATVDSTGKVTAKAVGTATITCTAKDGSGVKATCKVTVKNPVVKVSKVALNKTSASLVKDDTLTLKATVTPTTATNKAVTWKSSNTKVATVSSTGRVTAKAAGTVTITCTAKDGSGKTATCKITVYNNTQAYVARIYTKALGRAAEPAGLNYWTNEIQSGKRTPVKVAEEFFFAPEFTNKNLNNTEYVKVLYRTFMGREYDKGGLDYWVGRLNKGESRKSVLEAFAGCPEFQKIVKSFGL